MGVLALVMRKLLIYFLQIWKNTEQNILIEYLELKKRLAVIKEEIQEILKKYDYNSYEYSMQNKLMEVLSVLYELRKSVSV